MPTKKTTLDDGATSTDFVASGTAAERFSDTAKASVNDAAHRAERMIQDGLEILRANSRVYVDAAGEQFGTAQRYVTERVKERPVAATMAGVGVGLLLGLLLAGSRGRRH